MSDPAVDAAAIRAALEAATPGPWARRDQYVRTVGTEPDYVAESWKYADAELIVLLRNNAEALLDALAASEAKVARVEAVARTAPIVSTAGQAVLMAGQRLLTSRQVLAALADPPEQVSP